MVPMNASEPDVVARIQSFRIWKINFQLPHHFEGETISLWKG